LVKVFLRQKVRLPSAHQMRKTPGERLYLVRVAGNKVRQYTKVRLIQKLAMGKITPSHLVYGVNGAWLPVGETHGFRTFCAKLQSKSTPASSPPKGNPVPLPDRILKKLAEMETQPESPPDAQAPSSASFGETSVDFSGSKIVIPPLPCYPTTQPESWMLRRGFRGQTSPSGENNTQNPGQNKNLEDLLEQLMPQKATSENDTSSGYGLMD